MTTVETPREFYYRLEKQLSPVLRKTLAENLPKIAGENWWKNCVLTSLSPIQLDNVRQEQTLEQFDYPALVNIFYHNWRNLRPLLSIGNEITNYLFSIKTLRNDVEHQPDLVLTEARKVHLEQSVNLALELLNSSKGRTKRTKTNQSKILSLSLVSFLILITTISSVYYFQLNNQQKNTRDLSSNTTNQTNNLTNEETNNTQPTNITRENNRTIEKDCGNLQYILKNIKKYGKLINVDKVFAEEKDRFNTKCSKEKNFTKLTDYEKIELNALIRNKVDNHIASTDPQTITSNYTNDIILRRLFSFCLENKVYPEDNYNKYKKDLENKIKVVQRKYGLKETCIPNFDFLTIIEDELKNNVNNN